MCLRNYSIAAKVTFTIITMLFWNGFIFADDITQSANKLWVQSIISAKEHDESIAFNKAVEAAAASWPHDKALTSSIFTWIEASEIQPYGKYSFQGLRWREKTLGASGDVDFVSAMMNLSPRSSYRVVEGEELITNLTWDIYDNSGDDVKKILTDSIMNEDGSFFFLALSVGVNPNNLYSWQCLMTINNNVTREIAREKLAGLDHKNGVNFFIEACTEIARMEVEKEYSDDDFYLVSRLLRDAIECDQWLFHHSLPPDFSGLKNYDIYSAGYDALKMKSYYLSMPVHSPLPVSFIPLLTRFLDRVESAPKGFREISQNLCLCAMEILQSNSATTSDFVMAQSLLTSSLIIVVDSKPTGRMVLTEFQFNVNSFSKYLAAIDVYEDVVLKSSSTDRAYLEAANYEEFSRFIIEKIKRKFSLSDLEYLNQYR